MANDSHPVTNVAHHRMVRQESQFGNVGADQP